SWSRSHATGGRDGVGGAYGAGASPAGRTGPAPLRQGVRGRCLSGGAYGAGARRRSGAGGHDGAGYRGAVRRRVGVALVAVAVLGGCASPVTVPPGPHAADPVCAEVLQLVPGELAGGEERSISSQATAAWGEPPVTLRCGVEVPGPS